MLSLMLNICLAGQPCKEVRVADFFTAQASFMCNFNRDGMQESARKEGRAGTTFSCKSGMPESKLKALATLNFNICVNQPVASSTTPAAPVEQCESFPMAQFYGKEYAKPACTKNADHMRPAIQQAAAATNARVKLECHM
jgi:hypothetical protein